MNKFFRYAIYIIVGGVFIFILIETIKAKNTGFETKKLWDWMDLFLIPLVLALGAFLLNRSERETERKNLKDSQQEQALQSYIDRMSDLLLDENLRTTKKDKVRDVARTRTLAVLRRLDGNRKMQVIQFLYEANLIHKKNSKVDLRGADLSSASKDGGADLRDAKLMGVNLFKASLIYVDLRGADLRGAHLGGAKLGGADLRGADLSSPDKKDAKIPVVYNRETWLRDADLRLAKLDNANLKGVWLINTKLSGAELRGADLRGAHLVGVDLTGAFLESAKYNIETSWPEGFDPKAAGAIMVDEEGKPVEQD